MEWRDELAQQNEEIPRSDDMTTTGNGNGVTSTAPQHFTHYATAAQLSIVTSKKPSVANTLYIIYYKYLQKSKIEIKKLNNQKIRESKIDLT